MKCSTLMRRGRRNAPQPGTAEWRTLLTASKIPAVMGTSPWSSRFTLWHEMAGTFTPEPINPAVLERGHILEPAVAAWFQAQHPEWVVRECGGRWWEAHSFFAATPDRIIADGPGSGANVIGLLEIKTAARSDGWGAAGTAEIPAGYYDQVQFQLACTGVQTAYVAVLLGGLEFREYVVPRDDARIGELVTAGTDFMDSLHAEEVPDFRLEAGDFDVYETMRAIHPEIEDESVELSPAAANAAARHVRLSALAKLAEARAKTLVAGDMEMARTGTFCGSVVAKRMARGQGRPYVSFTKPKKTH
nr:MAG TPA: Exonuclease [Caudoviricetes sp.]